MYQYEYLHKINKQVLKWVVILYYLFLVFQNHYADVYFVHLASAQAATYTDTFIA